MVSGYVSESESDVSELADEIVLNVIRDEEESEKTKNLKTQVSPETSSKPAARKAFSLTREATLASGPVAQVKKSKSVRFSVSPVSPPSPQKPASALPTSTTHPPLPATPTHPTTVATSTATTTAAAATTSTGSREQPVATSQLPSTLPWKQLVPTSNKVLKTVF